MWGKPILVLNVALIAAVAIVGLQYVQNSGSSEPNESAQPNGVASTLPDPSTGVPSTDAAEPPPQTEPPPRAEVTAPPKVRPTMRANFAAGDPWPVGAGFRETAGVSMSLGILDRLMTHGPPDRPGATSWLERGLDTDVRTLGARVRFAPNHSGAIALTAWYTSILETSGIPRTGMRLVATPGEWRLVAIDGDGKSTITTGRYRRTGESATFSMVRQGRTLWVTDPTGTVTQVKDPRVGSFSGPWASWELRETSTGQRPAGFLEIWAG